MSKDVVFSYKTNGGSSPENKPKVYLTCHPADFDRFNDSICKDLFDFSNCAVFYTEDMEADLNNENSLIDLERMNLFVIPVTYRLLTEPNRAIDFDLKFAKEKHIPVLPLMMEPDLYDYYKDPDKFGELQYLKPNDHDLTSVNYRDKLNKYLNSVLISDELIDKIRAEFDAYIFLSYRKKDRKLANDLMRMIHDNPECEDVAIWFDEFLTPGKSFKNKIHESMQDSKLIAMLVTPRILEHYSNGSPNFIMSDEYPEAKRLNKPILPIEMEPTDKEKLNQSFPALPDCADTNDTDSFNKRLLEALSGIYNHANNDDPEHNYLIGLAYLEGIDVEKDIDRAVKLLTKAAESGSADALFKLYDMYKDGKGVAADFQKATYWSEKLYEYHLSKSGKDNADTQHALNIVANNYYLTGDYHKSIELSEKSYSICCDTWKENYANAVEALQIMSLGYLAIGQKRKALNQTLSCYKMCCNLWGEESESALESLATLAYAYIEIEDLQKAIELADKGYKIACNKFGPDYMLTIKFSNILIILQKDESSLAKLEETYEQAVRKHGKNHPQSLTCLMALITYLYDEQDFERVVKLSEEAYPLSTDLMGEDHLSTTIALFYYVSSSYVLDKTEVYLELAEKCYRLVNKHMKKNNPMTCEALRIYALALEESGNYEEAIVCARKLLLSSIAVFGIEDLSTIEVLHLRARLSEAVGDYIGSTANYHVYYLRLCKALGDNHSDCIDALVDLKESIDLLYEKAVELYQNEDYVTAQNYFDQCYQYYLGLWGPTFKKTIESMDMLVSCQTKTGQHLRDLE